MPFLNRILGSSTEGSSALAPALEGSEALPSTSLSKGETRRRNSLSILKNATKSRKEKKKVSIAPAPISRGRNNSIRRKIVNSERILNGEISGSESAGCLSNLKRFFNQQILRKKEPTYIYSRSEDVIPKSTSMKKGRVQEVPGGVAKSAISEPITVSDEIQPNFSVSQANLPLPGEVRARSAFDDEDTVPTTKWCCFNCKAGFL